MAVQIQVRRDTSSNWNSTNPLLAEGEFGFDITVNKLKFGDGINYWTGLTYSTNGENGTSGINGTSGSSGENGTSGSSGLSGTDGTSGSSGISGTDGLSGTDGTSGSSGKDGQTYGTSGSSGIDGTNGIDGTSGSSGVSGTDGTSGSSGVSGTDGTSGSSGVDGISGGGMDPTIANGAILYNETDATSGSSSFVYFPEKRSVAIGTYNPTSIGTDSLEVGFWNYVNDGAFAVGLNNQAYANGTFCAGYSNYAGNTATCLGAYSDAQGYGSLAQGYDVSAQGFASTVFGTRNTTLGVNQTIVGQYCVASGSTDELDKNSPKFMVGTGYFDGTAIRETGFLVRGNADTEIVGTLSVGRGLKYSITNISDAYTGLTTDQYIRCSGSTYTVKLPAATGSGKLLMFKSLASGTITLEAATSEYIDQLATKDITTAFSSLKLIDAAVGQWETI